MISLPQIENLIEITSTTKIQELINYLNGKNISELNPLFVQEDLNLDENQIDSLTKILTQIKDVDLLLVTLESVSLCHEQKNDQLSQLIMTGDFDSKYANFTDDTIFQMIKRAKFKITIVSYFVWDGQDLFKQLSNLSKNIEIKFILDEPQKWKSRIIKNWNKRTLPKIFGINRKKLSKEKLSKIHSKIVIVDNSEILITSANLTSVAMETFGKTGNNIETGIWSKDQQIVNNCIKIFDDFERKEIITYNDEDWE